MEALASLLKQAAPIVAPADDCELLCDFGLGTPFDHTCFFPDFTHVNVMPPTNSFAPSLLHLEPGFGAAAVESWAVPAMSERARIAESVKVIDRSLIAKPLNRTSENLCLLPSPRQE